jgi:hypothetical protein
VWVVNGMNDCRLATERSGPLQIESSELHAKLYDMRVVEYPFGPCKCNNKGTTRNYACL